MKGNKGTVKSTSTVVAFVVFGSGVSNDENRLSSTGSTVSLRHESWSFAYDAMAYGLVDDVPLSSVEEQKRENPQSMHAMFAQRFTKKDSDGSIIFFVNSFDYSTGHNGKRPPF